MRTKHLIIAMIWAALPFDGIFAADERFLVLNAKDGTKTTFALSENPKISFSNGELSVVCSNRTFSISLADIQNYAFLQESTGIAEVIKDGSVKLENGFVVFNGLATGSKVAVYMQDGKLVRKGIADSKGSAVLSLSGLPKGILILQSNKTSIKVINK